VTPSGLFVAVAGCNGLGWPTFSSLIWQIAVAFLAFNRLGKPLVANGEKARLHGIFRLISYLHLRLGAYP
jgi:hypothetical protein